MRTPVHRLLAAGVAAAALLLAPLAGSAAPPATAAGPTAADPAASGDELPVFTSTGAIVDRFNDDTWNPTNEYIFPSVFHASEHLEAPIAEWYVYYAPHDAPGGINLMTADSLDGPWTQHPDNPIIENSWEPHYSTVSHVSAPDAIWNEEAGELFLYFHGENTTDRYATSTDGVTFEYGGEVMTTDQFGRDATEVSYNRIFEHPDATSEWAYGMFFMVNDTSNVRRIALALSRDGVTWEAQPGWVVDPGAAEGTNVSAADLWEWEGQHYVVYGSSAGVMFARTIDETLTQVGEAQALYIPQSAPPEGGRATSPQIVTDDAGVTHMLYEAGGRSETTILHAVLDPDGVRDPLNTRPEDPMYAQCTGAGSDEFDGASLGSAWSVVRDDPTRYRVEDGSLVMTGPITGLDGAPIVHTPLPARDTWEVTTQLRFDPTQRFQQAGLVLYGDDRNSARAMWVYSTQGVRFDVTLRDDGRERFDSWTWPDSVFPPADFGDTWQVRYTNDGEWITTSYSIDGETFQRIGRPISVEALGATSVGFTAYRGTAGADAIDASFDWLRFTPTDEELAACEAAPVGEVAVHAVAAGRADVVPGGVTVAGVVTCMVDGEVVATADWSVGAGSTSTVLPRVAAGASCVLSDVSATQPPAGYRWADPVIAPASATVADGGTAQVNVVVRLMRG